MIPRALYGRVSDGIDAGRLGHRAAIQGRIRVGACVYLLDHQGFTVSPELQKRLLGQIKLADLTLGDLAGIAAPANGEKNDDSEVAQVRSLFPGRRPGL
jgi:hypothetical protein